MPIPAEKPSLVERHLGRRFGSIASAVEYSGVSRSSLYVEAAKRLGLFRKFANKTLVDFDKLDELLDALPDAAIKRPPAKQKRVKDTRAS